MKINLKPPLVISLVFALAMPLNVCASDQAKDRIVFQKGLDIYSANPDGSEERALTDNGHSHDPKLSPDGQRILYVHNSLLQNPDNDNERKYDRPTDLYVMNRDGSNARLLVHIEGLIGCASWEPDGNAIGLRLTSIEAQSGKGKISIPSGFYVINADGKDKPQMLLPDAGCATWSPDGKKLAFMVLNSPRLTIHVSDADGSDDGLLVNPEEYPVAESPQWSPDGRRIALSAQTKGSQTDHGWVSLWGIFLVNPDGSHLRQVYAAPEWQCHNASWSNDGKQIKFFCWLMPACQVGGSFISSIPDTPKPRPVCVRRNFVISADDPTAQPSAVGDGVLPPFTSRE